MNIYFNVIVSSLASAGISAVFLCIMKNYLNSKLQGSITKDIEKSKGEINKDIEKVKGEINKDVENFKGNINRDIAELKIKEDRTNILTSRYVDVVTNQRILWLEKMREDISRIVGLAKIVFFYDDLLKTIFNTSIMSTMFNKNQENNLSDTLLEDFKSKFYAKGEAISELLQLTTKLKLRLNYKSDTEIIFSLNKIEDGVIKNINQYEMNKILDKLVQVSQIMLKDEWEKVKDEVREGKERKYQEEGSAIK